VLLQESLDPSFLSHTALHCGFFQPEPLLSRFGDRWRGLRSAQFERPPRGSRCRGLEGRESSRWVALLCMCTCSESRGFSLAIADMKSVGGCCSRRDPNSQGFNSLKMQFFWRPIPEFLFIFIFLGETWQFLEEPLGSFFFF
jgi:hypothetical protein